MITNVLPRFGQPFVKQFALYAIRPLSLCPVCL